MGRELAPLARVARIAGRQHGVVTRAQLRAAGLGDGAIDARVGTVLHRVHRGVYRFGHRAPSAEAVYTAAVLACGEGAALRRRAAGHLLAIVRRPPPRPEVIAPRARRVPGIACARSDRLDPRDVTVHRGIPTTTVPRTLVDLAAVLDDDELARACHEADVRHGVAWPDVEPVLARLPRSRGSARLRAILTGDEPTSLSRLEHLFLAAVRNANLPPPETNRPAGTKRVDCRWPAHRLTVELDSYRFHRTRHAWEQDRRREREARARGDRHRRYTWLDVAEEPAAMLADLERLLG
jgi:hypothetical protein